MGHKSMPQRGYGQLLVRQHNCDMIWPGIIKGEDARSIHLTVNENDWMSQMSRTGLLGRSWPEPNMPSTQAPVIYRTGHAAETAVRNIARQDLLPASLRSRGICTS
jgi:hypothetical protein